MKKIIFTIATISCLVLGSCKKHESAPQHSFSGPGVSLGNGTVSTKLETDENNHVKSLSIVFEKKAFDNLPEHVGHDHGFTYNLALPSQKTLTPFDHVELNWNPHGHPPEHVYDKPHFDMHFYTITEAEQMSIPEYDVDSSGFLNYPAPAYLPANYVPIPGGEPMMGAHWVDITSPELSQTNPMPFTQTFIYGSYNGQVHFMEPMITLDFLTHNPGFTRNIPQPQKFSKDGYYPTRMSIVDKGSTIEVTLDSFVYHSRS